MKNLKVTAKTHTRIQQIIRTPLISAKTLYVYQKFIKTELPTAPWLTECYPTGNDCLMSYRASFVISLLHTQHRKII